MNTLLTILIIAPFIAFAVTYVAKALQNIYGGTK